LSTTRAKQIFRWSDLPAVDLLHGTMRRSGFRSDGCILTFNWVQPTMPRWEPHHHPFDQVTLTVKGRHMFEVEGEAMECTAGTITRVPANAKHTGWGVGDKPTLVVDVFAPPREDYLFLVAHQKEYPLPKGPVHKYPMTPTTQPFTGTVKTDTRDVLFAWDNLPTTDLADGSMKRSAFRGDYCLLTFNRISPRMTRAEPQSYPFDQIVMIATSRLMLEIDGETMECGPESIVRVPANASHARWPIRNEPVLTIDVFAPAPKDFLDLVKYQKEYVQ
jgi:mannose-6-phosphate isomerase-like protein (cupin superfamily)